MIQRILIANRGEIARRIIRTSRRMGLETVAVHSDADAGEPFVREAHHAVRIGPAPARESYLDTERLIAAARASGADAVHPGYGFLSENADFARACAAAGLTFIGPPAEVIAAMGAKIAAKRLAAQAGVPVVPGFEGDDGNDATLIAAARGVGFPLLVKASAGGGGRGMRAVEQEADLPSALAAARAEARAAFGDGALLLERLVRAARHVEVQVAADQHGAVVHLFERDCSLQRKNQKVIEEAPAPNLREGTRARLLADAVRLAAAIGYRNLGTMEFLVDAATGEHFFLEMNTRLQVEHPVTEAVTGLDLVEWQIRIADGEPLPIRQDEIRCQGHAIEARLAAERPDSGFLPATGRVALWRAPEGVRVDTGVETGSEIGVHYDSMIAKLIAHAPTREEARLRLARALDGLVVLGLDTNRAFLADLLRGDAFAAGRATTASIVDAYPQGWQARTLPPDDAAAIAAALWVRQQIQPTGASPWQTLPGFRLMAAAGRPAVYDLTAEIEGESIACAVTLDGGTISAGGHTLQASPEGAAFAIRFGSLIGTAAIDGRTVWGVARQGAGEPVPFTARIADPLAASAAAGSAAPGGLVAAMPGSIVEVRAAPGDAVSEGDTLVVMESMKLMMPLTAPRAGRVAAVHVRTGETVAAGARLIDLDPA